MSELLNKETVKRVEKSLMLYNQWDHLIRELKKEGALLNHIRP